MGDPKKHKKKYTTPNHPWQKDRIDKEREIRKVFGTSNKKEIWKMNSQLKSFQDRIKTASSEDTPQGNIEKEELFKKLQDLKLIKEEDGADKVLSLQLEDIMKRRLQSLVLEKGLAKTSKQARQFITHRHIMIGEKVITSPSYLVTSEGESKISFVTTSTLNDPEHPERVVKEIEEAQKLKEDMEEIAKEAEKVEVVEESKGAKKAEAEE